MVLGQCDIPSFLADASWWDSDKGLVTFGQSNLTGWDVRLLGGVIFQNWECLHTQASGASTYLIMKYVDYSIKKTKMLVL